MAGAANGGAHAAGGSTAPGSVQAGGVPSQGGSTSRGGTSTVGRAGETIGGARERPATAGEATGAAGEPPLPDAGGAGAGGQPDASAGAGGASPTCESGGHVYQVGERFTAGCATCSCTAGGIVSCDDRRCHAICVAIAKKFAALRAEAARCDIADPNACTQFVGPASLSCDCPVPYAVDNGATAQVLLERYVRDSCGKPNPECECPAWETASCVEGICEGTAP